MALAGELTELRLCTVPSCAYNEPNGLTDVDHILRAMNNHILGVYPVVSKNYEGGAAKSMATIPMLEESITEIQYSAWLDS